MSDWRDTTLGDVCELKRGYDLPGINRLPGTVPIVSSSGITGYHATAKVRGPGVVTGRYGTLGQVFLISEDFWPLNTALYVRDFKGNEPRFVAALLESLDLGLNDGAAAVPGVNRNQLHGLRVSCPDVAIQRRISDVLMALDDLRENHRQRVNLLERMARDIYRESFVRFRYPGHERDALVDSPVGMIPGGWTTPQLAAVVSTQYGYTEAADDKRVGPHYLRGMDINKSSFVDWSTVPYCPIAEKDLARFKIAQGDVFVIRMADPGKVGICEVEVDAVFASYLVRLRPIDDRITPYYLFFTLTDDAYQAWATGASTGATRKSLSAKVMTEPIVVLPPREQQLLFSDRIQPVRLLLTELVKANANLSSMRDLLLPKLVTGQIDVSKLDLDALVESVA